MLQAIINAMLPRERGATIQTLGHPAAGVIDWFDSGTNSSGKPVTESTALTYSAVWCATRIISETLATLPCVLYRTTSSDSRERAKDDPRYFLLHDEPNPNMSPITFFETLTANMVLHGNCYAEIVPLQSGDAPAELRPRPPEKVRAIVEGDSVRYELIDPKDDVPADKMLHVPALGGDGISGWSVIKTAAQSIGTGLAGDERSASQYRNNAMPSGAIVHPMRQSREAREQLRREWNEIHGGSRNAGSIAILHGGMDFKPFSMSNDDMQFLESRQFSIREIARWFRLPPHMLGDLQDSAVRANIEQQAIEFIVYSMSPWIIRWQQTLNRKLLSREERKSMYFEFLLDALLRGDIQSRYQAYATARQWGWFSVNDIRRMENLNAVDGGDIYLQPVNMIEAGTVPNNGTQDMQQNLAASISEILEQGKVLRDDIANGGLCVVAAMNSIQASTDSALAGLREDREQIKRDLAEFGKAWVRGSDLEAERAKLEREKLACAVKVERNAVIKAARVQQERGESFLNWMDSWYASNDRLPEDWKAESQRQLLEACDGDPAGFVQRVQAVLDSWEERINGRS